MPVSDASAKRAAAWLAAWARAGLVGRDPEVAGYVADLIQFVGERTMENHGELYLDVCGALGWGYDPNSDPVPSVLRAVPDLLARVRELECQLAGEQKANALLNAGMGDVCEGRDQLKHRARELEADNARLREGLRPFADAGIPDNWPAECVLTWDAHDEPHDTAFVNYLPLRVGGGPTVGDYRRAAEFLGDSQ